MGKERFAGVVDTVGGNILAEALKQVKYDGVVTCCGLVASISLNTNVFPFILRGVRLIGIDSVEASLDKKTQVWEKIANEFKIDTLNELVDEISLDEIQQAYQKILQGKAVGRYLVKL
jgi:NADPH:quinone reductase-like Zn-dependent oxidoreductase